MEHLSHSLVEAKKEQLRGIVKQIDFSIKDLYEFYSKNRDLEFVKELYPEIHEIFKAWIIHLDTIEFKLQTPPK